MSYPEYKNENLYLICTLSRFLLLMHSLKKVPKGQIIHHRAKFGIARDKAQVKWIP